MLTETALLQIIRSLAEADSQKVLARKLHISEQYLCDVLKKRRSISVQLAAALGYQRVIMFKRETP